MSHAEMTLAIILFIASIVAFFLILWVILWIRDHRQEVRRQRAIKARLDELDQRLFSRR